ncbi:hypothetical protein B0T20DRAFT_364418 [Sordaria brevicollis]|uniref:Uncharacterized protein n=1 Tax=Sordaria brevicollis TaxID=83679 RepID=A0AAE0NW13_SORBR|nr:hypothetical protein B0T20DRAFT_364418 [Sordaria brevicollis]
MGATLSQPVVPSPSSPSSAKTKSSKRRRFRFRLRIRWRRKKKPLHEIRAIFPESLGQHDHREYRESKLYDSSSTDERDENNWPSSPTLPIYPLPLDISRRKPLPSLPPSVEMESLARNQINCQANNTLWNNSSQLGLTEDSNSFVEDNSNREDHTEDETEQQHVSDPDPNSDFDSESDISLEERQRPHTPPPWDTSLTGYGSVLEISRPFRARRVFEHPLVEGHFLANKENTIFSGGGPLAAEEKRRMWRVWEEAGGGDKGQKKPKGLRSKGRSNSMERERGHGKKAKKSNTKTNTKTKRMSEWRRWKPLPSYPACTDIVAHQRASSTCTWFPLVTGNDLQGACAEVFEEAEDLDYQAEDEKDDDEGGNRENWREEEDEDREDLDEAIKRFLEMKIPVDMESLYRLRASFAGEGMDTTDNLNVTGEEATEGEMNDKTKGIEKEMEVAVDQGQLSPLVESLFFTDTDIEGFEFQAKEENKGGKMSNTEGMGRSGRGSDVSDEAEIVKMRKSENGEQDAGREHRGKKRFQCHTKIESVGEIRLNEERGSESRRKVE